MKLNFNFDGKTMLKNWWQIVRDNFTTIQTDHNELQTAHNTLSDKVSQEIKDRQSDTSSLTGKINNETMLRQNADNALQRSIDDEIESRQTADKNISDLVKAEESARKSADKELKARIDEINTSSDTNILFGEKMQHIIKFVAPEKPTLYFDGQQEYYGNSMTVDITLKNAFSIDGKTIDGTFSGQCINVPIDGIYIVVKYDFVNNICSIGASEKSVPSEITGDLWTFTLYHIHDINLEFKIDSESPTEERYDFVSAEFEYIVESEDSTGDTYFITNTYERVRTLNELATDNKNSFLDAINENAETLSGITKNQVFVKCDGDHDELKLQAAIKNAPPYSVIYPVGECVITNDNIISASSGIMYDSVIRLRGMILDGTYCERMIFKNTAPAEQQCIFYLNQAEMRNIEFWEDAETVTQTSINPTVVYATSGSVIRSCQFNDIFDTNQSSMAVFDCSTVKFILNTIDGFTYGMQSLRGGYGFKTMSDSIVFGNTFKNLVQSPLNSCKIVFCYDAIFQNNIISDASGAGISLKGNISGNVFKGLNDIELTMRGIIIGNDYR